MRRQDVREALAAMSDDDLENEAYTLTHERRYLDLGDDEVAERLSFVEAEQARRMAARFEEER